MPFPVSPKRDPSSPTFTKVRDQFWSPKKFIPHSALQTSKKIIDKLKIFPEANYSIDFLFSDARKPVLMEINTTPGFDLLHLVATEKIKEDNLRELIKVIP